jgi:hypothetical protein
VVGKSYLAIGLKMENMDAAKSLLGIAIDYTPNQWKTPTVYLADGGWRSSTT